MSIMISIYVCECVYVSIFRDLYFSGRKCVYVYLRMFHLVAFCLCVFLVHNVFSYNNLFSSFSSMCRLSSRPGVRSSPQHQFFLALSNFVLVKKNLQTFKLSAKLQAMQVDYCSCSSVSFIDK